MPKRKIIKPAPKTSVSAEQQASIKLEPLLTIPQVMEILGMSYTKVYYLIRDKELPAIKDGRNVRVKPSVLRSWIDARDTTLNA